MTETALWGGPQALVAVAQQCLERYPDATLVKNGVGNLSVTVDGEWVGYIDLQTAELQITEPAGGGLV